MGGARPWGFFVALAGAAVVALTIAAPVGAIDAPAGVMQLVAPNGTSLASGSAATSFAVQLPAGARCPGDTADDFFLVDSYLVPQGTSPAAVSFRGGVPSRGFGFINDGAYFGAVNTARNTGEIVTLPTDANWTRLTPANLFPNGQPSAVWEAGIVCADRNGQVAAYWNREVTFHRAAGNSGFTFDIAGAKPTSTSHSTRNFVLGVAIGAVVLAIAFAFSRARRKVHR